MAHFTSPLAEQLAPDVVERLTRYARVDTQSDRDGDGTMHPSTPGQLDLLRLLVEELHGLGLADAALEDRGFVFATLPATVEGPVETIGLLAHVDVSPDAPGAGVEPILHRDYDGSAIALPRGGTVLDPERMPELLEAVGHDLVTSSGDTLLGADDKAGVAEIMAAVAHLAAHPELPRPTIRVGFTPDEEIGTGSLHFPVARFGARAAYTVDGSTRGELQDETFTAAAATVTVIGRDVHPGFATGKLVNAARVAARILAALPSDRLTPETTSGRDGFIHPYELSGTAARATISLIVRDFDDDLLAEHVALLRRTVEEVAATEPRAQVTVEVNAQYPNMRRFVDAFPQVVEAAEAAIRAEGIELIRTPIRGGTDGSLISALGLPTPNLFTGGHEYHSVREWASVQDMAASAATLVRLAETWTTAPYRPA
jgi:tripeptide aminopeptidase